MTVEFDHLGKELKIMIPAELRNKAWAVSSYKIREAYETHSFQKVVIDFTSNDTIWIDPLPLLWLLCLCKLFKEKGIGLIVNLPSKKKSRGVIGFLYHEGFLETFHKLEAEIYLSESPVYGNESEIDLKTLSDYLIYKDPHILSATIVNTNELDVVSHVEAVITECQHRIKYFVPSHSRRAVLSKIKVFLIELIENVKYHAYENDEKQKLCSYYIRYRQGLQNESLSNEHLITLEKYHNKEHEKWLPKTYFRDIQGCLELFILDLGDGIKRHYPDQKRFRNIVQAAMEEGRRGVGSRDGSLAKTKFGGLYLLGKIFDKQFLSTKDENEWIGDIIPINYKKYSDHDLFKKDAPYGKGVSFLARISWDYKSDVEDNWDSLDKVDLLKVLKKSVFNPKVDEHKYGIIDERFKVEQSEREAYWIRHFEKISQDYDQKEFKSNFIVLPCKGSQKNQIKAHFENLFELKNFKNGHLVIADIPIEEAIVYKLAFLRANFQKKFVEKFKSLTLITRGLRCLELIRNKETYVERVDGISKSNFLALFTILREYDSYLIWTLIRIENENKNINYSIYPTRPIKWYLTFNKGEFRTEVHQSELKLRFYLNFAQTLSDPVISSLYKIGIERVTAISGSDSTRFIPEGVLTQKIAEEVNDLFYISTDLNVQNYLLIGSTYVTGSTFNESEHSNYEKIFFFKNPTVYSDDEPFTALETNQIFLWPVEKWIEDNFPYRPDKDYRRVGNTHVVAEFGWKSYPIPRFFKTGESAYGMKPKEMYEVWQDETKDIISIGHYDYEGWHDLVKIDFKYVFEESVKFDQKLVVFLLSRIISFLDGRVSELSHLGRMKPAIELDKQRVELNEEMAKGAIMVYPAHINTLHIVEGLKRFLPKNISDKIFALFPLKRERHGSSFLISPLIFESIKSQIESFKKLHSKEPVRALLFDCTTVSGKTKDELTQLLLKLGVMEVNFLFIMDRRRLPYIVPAKPIENTYWRLDIPRLGSHNDCPICNAIGTAQRHKNYFMSDDIRNRIDQWMIAWSAKSPSSANYENGLRPVKVNLTNPERKFGIKQTKDGSIQISKEGENPNDNLIKIKNSRGLSIYTCEIHSMTTRNDILISEINNNVLSYAATLELLCVNLLHFSSEFSIGYTEILVFELFNISGFQFKESNNYTSLAALTLLSLKEKHIKRFINKIEKFIQVGNRLDNIANRDIRIALSILVRRSNHIGTLENLKTGSKRFLFWRKVLLIQEGFEKLRNHYRDLHYEVWNDFGSFHDRPWHKVLSNEPGNKLGFLSESKYSLLKISSSLREIFYKKYGLSNEKVEDELSSCLKKITEIVEVISKLKLTTKKLKLTSKNEKKIVELFRSFKEHIIFLHSTLLVPVGVRPENRGVLLSELQIISNSKDLPKVRIESITQNEKWLNETNAYYHEKEFELWIPWDQSVKEELKAIFDNIKHSTDDRMKIEIDFQKKNNHDFQVAIKIRNNCSDNLKEEEVRNKWFEKWRSSKEQLINLNVEVSYSKDADNSEFITLIALTCI